jgi:hypothetical protein
MPTTLGLGAQVDVTEGGGEAIEGSGNGFRYAHIKPALLLLIEGEYKWFII